MRRIIVGVIGPASDREVEAVRNARELGRLIAEQNWVLLTGGRNCGVMDAANEGARQANGLTVGILPGSDQSSMSSSVDIPIVTGMGQARNNINVLSSDILIACGLGAGTASEIALAIKARKTVILLSIDDDSATFFQQLGPSHVHIAETPATAVDLARKLLGV